MKPFGKVTSAYLVCSAGLFMAGTTLLPVAGLGGLVRDVLMLSVCGMVLYGLLTVQASRREVDVERAPEAQTPANVLPEPAPRTETIESLRRAA